MQAAGREIDLAGLRRVVIKSDQEPALKDLLRVVKAERPEAIELQPEESPVGESKSNGEIQLTYHPTTQLKSYTAQMIHPQNRTQRQQVQKNQK